MITFTCHPAFDQILQCILVEGIESATIDQSSIFGFFYLPGTSKSPLLSHLVGLRHALQHQVLEKKETLCGPRCGNPNPCFTSATSASSANYGCNIFDSTQVPLISYPKTSPHCTGDFFLLPSSRRCEKKTWELRYLGREESSW